MTTLSRDRIKALALAAGFTGNNAEIATAIALAESGGKVEAHNATPPDDSYGLWQINMYGSLGPSRRNAYGLKSNSDLLDPTVNARVAYSVYTQSGFAAWTTYTSGKYKQFMSSNGGGGTEDDGSVATTLNPLDMLKGIAETLSGSVNAFGNTVFKASANFTAIIAAVALVIVGIVILLRNQIGGAVDTVKDVI